MKTLKLFAFCLLAILIGLTTSCSKDDGPDLSLPPITETGENTFGCYINDRLLVPRDGSGTFNAADPGIIFWGSPTKGEYNELDVHDFASKRTANINIHLLKLDSIGKGIYVVNESNCEDQLASPETNNIYCRIYDYKENIYKWYCSFEDSGEMVITRHDTINYIISGTFNCKVRNIKNPNDEIEITDGRFDINWDTVRFTSFP